mmetsp:Transcript_78262/g.226259  ORF Transcript_78262/g.226259 Transcript_78262/m.226259 type:complete len:237 (+) Transcript_78262:284-994(+)
MYMAIMCAGSSSCSVLPGGAPSTWGTAAPILARSRSSSSSACAPSWTCARLNPSATCPRRRTANSLCIQERSTHLDAPVTRESALTRLRSSSGAATHSGLAHASSNSRTKFSNWVHGTGSVSRSRTASKRCRTKPVAMSAARDSARPQRRQASAIKSRPPASFFEAADDERVGNRTGKHVEAIVLKTKAAWALGIAARLLGARCFARPGCGTTARFSATQLAISSSRASDWRPSSP